MTSPSERNLLIAVDASENSRKAVDYVGRLLGGVVGDFHITLLHLILEPDADYFPSKEEHQIWIDQKLKESVRLLEGYRDVLIGYGFEGDRIRVLTPIRFCPSISECILEQKDMLEYGTIVVGRKGLSPKEEILLGSVSSRLVKLARNCTVWVVNA